MKTKKDAAKCNANNTSPNIADKIKQMALLFAKWLRSIIEINGTLGNLFWLFPSSFSFSFFSALMHLKQQKDTFITITNWLLVDQVQNTLLKNFLKYLYCKN